MDLFLDGYEGAISISYEIMHPSSSRLRWPSDNDEEEKRTDDLVPGLRLASPRPAVRTKIAPGFSPPSPLPGRVKEEWPTNSGE